jgi:predicted RNA-binding protein YlqC (UPF0109 family)
MKKLILTITQALVDYPDEIEVIESEDNTSITYQLRVHPNDMGKVIGKQGRVAKAIRTVVYAAANQDNKKVYIEIGHE